MRHSQHTEIEIHDYLGRANAGTAIAEVCSMARITPRTFYRWRARYGGVSPATQRALKDLQLENSRLRAVVASLSARVAAGSATRAGHAEAIARHDHGGASPAGGGASLGRFAFVRGSR